MTNLSTDVQPEFLFLHTVRFEHAARRAADLANDLELFKAKKFLESTLTRGGFVIRRFGSVTVALLVPTDKCPNTRGLSKAQIERNLRGVHAIQTAQRPGSAVGATPFTVGARGRESLGAPASRGDAASSGRPYQRAPPAGFALLSAGGVARGRDAADYSPVSLGDEKNHDC